MSQRVALTSIILLFIFHSAKPQSYNDSRPVAKLRMDAKDTGVVLRYGDGPDSCDIFGARNVWVSVLRGQKTLMAHGKLIHYLYFHQRSSLKFLNVL
jgi:hypothetical protein